MSAGVDLRRFPRHVTDLPAWLRSSGKARTQVRIVDLSTHGCRIDEAWGLILDSSVWLTLGPLQALHARVVWTHYSFAGLEFEVPLNPAVLERLLALAPAPTTAKAAELRDTSQRCSALAAGAFREETAAHLLDLARDCDAAAAEQQQWQGNPRA